MSKYENVRKKVRSCWKIMLQHMVDADLLDKNRADSVRWEKGIAGGEDKWTPDVNVMRSLLPGIFPPFLLMTKLACTTGGLGPAELMGIRLRSVNLTNQPLIVEGTTLPRRSLYILEDCIKRKFGTVKTPNRKRVLPIPEVLIPELVAHIATLVNRLPNAPLFQYHDAGPLTYDHFHHLEHFTEELVVPVTPYAFRRYFAESCDRNHVPLEECHYLMGHSGLDMTRRYQKTKDAERRRKYVERIAKDLWGSERRLTEDGLAWSHGIVVVFPSNTTAGKLFDGRNAPKARRYVLQRIFGPVAQTVEHLPFKQRVAGSSPARLTSLMR